MQSKTCNCGVAQIKIFKITLVKARFNDSSCFSDPTPYIVIRYGRNVFKTQTEVGCRPVFKTTFSCEIFPISDINVELHDRGFFSTSKLSGCRIPFPQIILNETCVDGWYNLFKWNTNTIHGEAHIVLGCMSVCPRFRSCYRYNVYNPYHDERLSSLCYAIIESHTPNFNCCNSHHTLPSLPNPTEELNKLKEMFPNLSEDVLKDILIQFNYDLTLSSNACVELQKDSVEK
ncbi:hypothetical protein HZS_1756, partial [Henneguya salminicola]